MKARIPGDTREERRKHKKELQKELEEKRKKKYSGPACNGDGEGI